MMTSRTFIEESTGVGLLDCNKDHSSCSGINEKSFLKFDETETDSVEPPAALL